MALSGVRPKEEGRSVRLCWGRATDWVMVIRGRLERDVPKWPAIEQAMKRRERGREEKRFRMVEWVGRE